MKKLISLILILCMACMLVPAVADEDITGDWYMTEMTVEGATVELSSMGMSISFHLNADGTLKMSTEMMGKAQEQDGTWTMDGDAVTFTIDGKAQAGAYADGKISIESEGQIGVLTREQPTAAEKPATVAAESEEAFFGTWTLSAMETMGMYITKDQFEAMQMTGYDATITIEAGKVISDMKMGEGQEEQKDETPSKFEDGKLILTIEVPEAQAEMLKAMGMEISDTATIELVEDGSILYSMQFMGMDFGMYLAPAEAAAEEPAA